jgi:rhodanese-related sulfurtransferase
MTSIRIATIAVMLTSGCFGQASPAPAHRPAGPGYQALVKEAKSRIKEITAAQLKAWRDAGQPLTLIDVREDSEWQAGHAAGAVHIGRGILEWEIEAAVPRKEASIVLYCQGGARSALAADTLQRMGYTNVVSLAGGFGGYQAAGLPQRK